ncbi:signal peptidase II [Conexibacter sp. W3-3-2]|uniref:signal peptidase II n=1 Tax=Conexibacter sp. W3-3-2 TaxID=2675227 RepID=UPI001E4EC785|nr:signal peptidase II [Conexibacter sp. W3-3-2]
MAGIAVTTDLSTKVIAERMLSPGVGLPFGARLELSHNTGVAFGGFAGAPNAVVVAVVMLGVAGLAWAILSDTLPGGTSGGMLLGGAVANLADRLEGGGVTDFVDVGAWPSFNLVDVYLTVGVLLMVFSLVRGEDRSTPDPAPPEPHDPATSDDPSADARRSSRPG